MEEKPANQDEIRNEKGQFKKGKSGNPNGRPKGVSFTQRIKEIFLNEPEKFEETCRYYMDDPRMKDLLWKMIDGMPKTKTDLTSNGESIVFKITRSNDRD